MTEIWTAFFYLVTCGGCFAQADFSFYVFDETKNDKLHYEVGQLIAVYDFNSQLPRFHCTTEYRVYGINQHEFSFTTDWYAGDLSRDDFASLLKKARELPLEGLDPNKNNEPVGSQGWVKLDGEEYPVTATPESDIRKKWQVFLDAIVEDYAPEKERKTTRKKLEGEVVAAKALDFATLLKDPKSFDGKRIRLTGFYHGEFEGSCFASSQTDIRKYDEALWLGGMSTFADPKQISGLNDVTLVVEGTFELGRAGHGGLFMGQLDRVTESKPEKSEQILPPKSNLSEGD